MRHDTRGDLGHLIWLVPAFGLRSSQVVAVLYSKNAGTRATLFLSKPVINDVYKAREIVYLIHLVRWTKIKHIYLARTQQTHKIAECISRRQGGIYCVTMTSGRARATAFELMPAAADADSGGKALDTVDRVLSTRIPMRTTETR